MATDRSERLKLAREASGFATPTEAARHFRWSFPTYAAHENGGRDYHRVADRYARAYRVSESWLLTGEGKGPGELDPVEEELVAIFRTLPVALREHLASQARILRAAAGNLAPGRAEPPDQGRKGQR